MPRRLQFVPLGPQQTQDTRLGKSVTKYQSRKQLVRRKKENGKHLATYTKVRVAPHIRETFVPCQQSQHRECASIVTNAGEVPQVCDCDCHRRVYERKARQGRVTRTKTNAARREAEPQTATPPHETLRVGDVAAVEQVYVNTTRQPVATPNKPEAPIGLKALYAKYAAELAAGNKFSKGLTGGTK